MDLNLEKKVGIVTGAGGAICGEIAKGLAKEGARVAIWDKNREAAAAKAAEISAAGGAAVGIACDVLSKDSVAGALDETLAAYESVDILVNGAGGSHKDATTSPEMEFFDIEPEALQRVMDLNYMSAVLPAQAVGRIFAAKKAGAILNVSSIGAMAPLSRSISYSNGKAATSNFTQWLAVHMAQTYSPAIRVNAIAPGFCLTGQNRFLLVEQDTGKPTARGRQIIDQVPMGRLGQPEELTGAALWLVSDQASFVTGSIVVVDGGYTAFGGV